MFESSEELITINKKDFEKLKTSFKEDINSDRRFEQITTVEQLVSVLEDRNTLTDDVLLKQEPKFIDFVKNWRKNHTDFKELNLPESVVTCISEDFQGNWKPLGEQLKLKEDQLEQCQNAQDILSYYTKNCEGVSYQEMIFRLIRGLEKCGKFNLKKAIVELMKQN